MSDGRGVAGIYPRFVGFNLRPLSANPLWKPVRKSSVASWDLPTVPSSRKRLSNLRLVDSACARSLRESSIETEGEEGLRGRLVARSFCKGSFPSQPIKTVIRIALVAILGQARFHSSDFQREAGSVDLVESIFQICGQEGIVCRHRRVSGANV